MKVLHLVLNGKSAARQDIREAVQEMRQDDVLVNVRVTWEFGDARRYAMEAAASGEGVLVAGGGDGTVNEVLNGLMDSDKRIPLAILPLGTANDFATSAGIPISHPKFALQLAAQGLPSAMDVGVANGQFFLNVASGGFGAEMTERTPVQLKNLMGGSAYALTAAVMAISGHPYRGKLTTPEHTYEGAIVMMAVGNGRQAGGGALLTPQAIVNDGLLDVMVVPDHTQDRLGHLLADLLQLKHGQSEHFKYLKVPSLRIESLETLQFNLDGEPIRGYEFDFSIRTKAIEFVFPENSPLLTV